MFAAMFLIKFRDMALAIRAYFVPDFQAHINFKSSVFEGVKW